MKRSNVRRPRRRAVKRRNARNGTTSLPRLPGTLAPQHMLVKLKYFNTYLKAIPTGGAVAAVNQFRMNSIHDPDRTNTLGTSCLGLAEWAKFYQQYRVYKTAYVVRISNLSSDTAIAGVLSFTNYHDATFSVSDFMRPLGRRFELGNKEGANKAVIKGIINLPKLRGVKPVQYKTETATSSGFQASPTTELEMSILCKSANNSIAPNVAFTVEFTYFVELISTQASPEAIDLNTGLPVVPVGTFATDPNAS